MLGYNSLPPYCWIIQCYKLFSFSPVLPSVDTCGYPLFPLFSLNLQHFSVFVHFGFLLVLAFAVKGFVLWEEPQIPWWEEFCGSRNNHIQGTDGGIPQQIIRQQESKCKRERHSQSVETPNKTKRLFWIFGSGIYECWVWSLLNFRASELRISNKSIYISFSFACS